MSSATTTRIEELLAVRALGGLDDADVAALDRSSPSTATARSAAGSRREFAEVAAMLGALAGAGTGRCRRWPTAILGHDRGTRRRRADRRRDAAERPDGIVTAIGAVAAAVSWPSSASRSCVVRRRPRTTPGRRVNGPRRGRSSTGDERRALAMAYVARGAGRGVLGRGSAASPGPTGATRSG